MANTSTRKRGSRQFWPRKRAKKPVARVGSWKSKQLPKETNLLGFPGYKVGMTSVGMIDNFSYTPTKGTEINTPVTVVECPPVKVMSIRLLAYNEYGNLHVVKEVNGNIKDKNLNRKVDVNKKSSKQDSKEDLLQFAKDRGVEEVRVKLVTNPSKTYIGKKKPDILESGLSGSVEDNLEYAYSILGTELRAGDVLSGGELMDSHGVTKGKGFQGAVKRFGVKLTAVNSEKKRRHAGNLGAWTPARVLPTTPLPGQHGYHIRTEWNKWVLKVSDNPEEVNPAGGFKRYGQVNNDFLLVKGSLQGPSSRLITLVRAMNPKERVPKVAPEITYISK